MIWRVYFLKHATRIKYMTNSLLFILFYTLDCALWMPDNLVDAMLHTEELPTLYLQKTKTLILIPKLQNSSMYL